MADKYPFPNDPDAPFSTLRDAAIDELRTEILAEGPFDDRKLALLCLVDEVKHWRKRYPPGRCQDCDGEAGEAHVCAPLRDRLKANQAILKARTEEMLTLDKELTRAHDCVKKARKYAHQMGIVSVAQLLQPAFYDALKRDESRPTQDKEK